MNGDLFWVFVLFSFSMPQGQRRILFLSSLYVYLYRSLAILFLDFIAVNSFLCLLLDVKSFETVASLSASALLQLL